MIHEYAFTERGEVERGFAEVFHQKIVPILKNRETEQIRRRRNLIVGAGGIGSFGVLAGFLVGMAQADTSNGFVIAAVGLVAAFGIAGYQQSKWRDGLGSEILPIVARFLGDMVYGREEISLHDFDDRGLLPRYTISELEDPIAGEHKGLSWAAVEARLSVRRGRRGGRRTVFRGLLMRIEIFGPAPQILMVPRGSAALTWLSELFSSTRDSDQRLETGIAPFDARVITYARDPEAARGFVNERFAFGLLEIGRSISTRPVAAGMQGKWLYLAIPHRRDFLSLGSLWTPVQRIEEDLHRVIEELTLPRRVIDMLSGR
ncbi:MAG: DUF3137 domain-containing protein [Pseudomonadota bacterium]